MFQFADIAVPGVERKLLAGAVRQLDGGLVILLAEAGDEKFCKGDDVFGPLAQRGYLEVYRIDAVQQVLAEFAFATISGRLRFVAQISRMSTGMGVLLPTRTMLRRWMAVSSLACRW